MAQIRKYSIDTSALIDGLERYYPEKHFPKLWEKVDELIANGQFLISEEVWREATAKDAAVKRWCTEAHKNRSVCTVITNNEVAKAVGEIMLEYPQWVTQGKKNGADPFVIAVAEVYGATVISGETNGGSANPKIPYVCRQRSVPCGKFIKIITSENWVIG